MIAQSDIPSSAELFTAHLGLGCDTQGQSFYTFVYIDQAVLKAAGGAQLT
jgi:hypothetical protein